jgi:hypothetical protein
MNHTTEPPRAAVQTGIPIFQVIHIIFASTITVWLNQIVQISVDLFMKSIGMYIVLAIVFTIVFGFMYPSMYVQGIIKKDYIGAARELKKMVGAIALLTGSVIFCGILSSVYVFGITKDLLFSSTFFLPFVVLLVIDLILLRKVGE